MPGERDFGFDNLRAEIDSKGVRPRHQPGQAPSDWQIPLPSPWGQKQKINLALSYDLAAGTPADPRIFVASDTFRLNDSGWFPTLAGFKAFLSASPARPSAIDLRVVVPPAFRLTASGQLRGTKRQESQTEYRFRIGDGDFRPYIVGGRYQQQVVRAGGLSVVFWTAGSISAEQAQKSAEPIAAAAAFCAKNFGPLPRSMKAFYVIPPAESASAGDLPLVLPGIVYDQTGGADAPVAVAGTWFEHMAVARPEARVLGTGLAVYASYGFAEAGNAGRLRTPQIASALSAYDRGRAKAVEKPIVSLAPADPRDQLRIGGDKIGLFLFALEDKCGRENLTHSIFDMVYALRGQEYGYADFRAALEGRCHQELGGFFRSWLAQPGIPADFRARYENAGAHDHHSED